MQNISILMVPGVCFDTLNPFSYTSYYTVLYTTIQEIVPKNEKIKMNIIFFCLFASKIQESTFGENPKNGQNILN